MLNIAYFPETKLIYYFLLNLSKEQNKIVVPNYLRPWVVAHPAHAQG